MAILTDRNVTDGQKIIVPTHRHPPPFSICGRFSRFAKNFVPIVGSAIARFLRIHLAAGSGLRPRNWGQVGEKNRNTCKIE